MSTAPVVRTVCRQVKKVERPRPLKQPADNAVVHNLSQSPKENTKLTNDDVLKELDTLNSYLNNSNFSGDQLEEYISSVHAHLIERGSELESTFVDRLDHYFVTFRHAIRENVLSPSSLLRLLELIELRAHKWSKNDNSSLFYQNTLDKIKELPDNANLYTTLLAGSPASPFIFNSSSGNLPGDILQSSGKYVKPTKIPGKNYYKDEVVIRNADSGKVMGIRGRRVHMIEQLSGTIISFQRVAAGAKDRLVQITGSNEESISNAKILIEDTIKRNASPTREKPLISSSISNDMSLSESDDDTALVDNMNKKPLVHSYSMGDASKLGGHHSVSLNIGGQILHLSGSDCQLVNEALNVLEEYFKEENDISPKSSSPLNTNAKPFIPTTYNTDKSIRNNNISIGGDGSNKPNLEAKINGDIKHSKVKTANMNEETPVTKSTPLPSSPHVPSRKAYSRDFLLQCYTLPASRALPKDWNNIQQNHPYIVRSVTRALFPLPVPSHVDPKSSSSKWKKGPSKSLDMTTPEGSNISP